MGVLVLDSVWNLFSFLHKADFCRLVLSNLQSKLHILLSPAMVKQHSHGEVAAELSKNRLSSVLVVSLDKNWNPGWYNTHVGSAKPSSWQNTPAEFLQSPTEHLHAVIPVPSQQDKGRRCSSMFCSRTNHDTIAVSCVPWQCHGNAMTVSSECHDSAMGVPGQCQASPGGHSQGTVSPHRPAVPAEGRDVSRAGEPGETPRLLPQSLSSPAGPCTAQTCSYLLLHSLGYTLQETNSGMQVALQPPLLKHWPWLEGRNWCKQNLCGKEMP